MKAMVGGIATAVIGLTLTGCKCVEISDVDYTETEVLNSQGIAWSIERDKGTFEPVVSMGAAVWYALLPGAGQLFMAHKIDCAIDDGRLTDPRASSWASAMRREAIPMLIFSWIPYVYDFTHPFGTAAVIVDVNRINNIALREALKRSCVRDRKE